MSNMMKKISILFLLACMVAAGTMAQGQKYRQRVIDRDYYPVESATVTVKGTKISTVTDRDGCFVLEGVPLVLDSIQVTKGKKSKTLPIPVTIEMKEEIQDRFSWFVKAGWAMGMIYGEEASMGNYYGGVGAHIRMSRHWFWELGVYYVRRYLDTSYNSYDYSEYDYDNIEIPFMFGAKFPIAKSTLMIAKFGGFYDRVLGGSFTADSGYEDHTEANGIEDSDRNQGGVAGGIGFEIRKHWLVDVLFKSGWVSGGDVYSSHSYMDLSLSVGYRF